MTIKTIVPLVNAFSGEGQYKFYNSGRSKWMGYDVAIDDILVADAGEADSNKFNIVANGDRFNMYTGDNQKVVIINSESGFNTILAPPTEEVLTSDDVLFSFTETVLVSEMYFSIGGTVDSNTGKYYEMNLKSNGSDVGEVLLRAADEIL